MTSDPTDDLGDLAMIWRGDEGPRLKDLPRQARRAALAAQIVFAVECAIAAAGAAAGFWVYWRGLHAIGVATVAFSLFGLAVAFWARAKAWRLETGTVAAELRTSLDQAKASYRAAWGGLWLCAAALVLLAVNVWVAFQGGQPTVSDYRRLAIAFAAPLVFVAGYIVVLAIALDRARVRLERLRVLAQSLGETG